MNLKTCCLIVACACVLGCGGSGPKTYSVSGMATYDGQLIELGDIRFIPDDKKLAAEGGRIENGKFSLKAKPGKNRIEINASKATGRKLPDAMGGMSEEKLSYIPAKYNSQTTLSEDISSSRSDLKFELAK